MKLPPISDPHRYAGLFVYDFGDHVSVGYTAAEINLLRGEPAHVSGTAYQIYRVAEDGSMEIRGILDRHLHEREALCFLYPDGARARRGYDTLRKAADGVPVPCSAELHLSKVYAFEPPDVCAIIYDATSSHRLSGWLGEVDFAGPTTVRGGLDAHREFATADRLQIDSCELRCSEMYRDRPAEEVLATVDRALQR